MTSAFGPRTRTRLAAAAATTALAAALTCTAALPAYAIAPTAGADFYAVIAGSPLMISAADGILANDTDPEGDPVAIHSLWSNGAALPGEELVTNPDGSFTYYPPTGFTGIREWLYRAQDATDVSPVVAITFTITAPPAPAGNVAPVGGADAYGVAQDGWVNVPAPGLLANDTDADGDALTLVAQGIDTVTLSGEGMTTWADGSLFYQAPTGFVGTRTWWYELSDGTHTVRTAIVFTITPAPVGNTAPVAGDDVYAIPAAPFDTIAPGVFVNDSDADGDALTVAKLATQGGALPGESFVIGADGAVHYVPPTGFTGTRTWRYTVSDGFAESDWATVSFQISAVPVANTAPAAAADAYPVVQDTKLVVGAPGLLANDTDADGDPIATSWTWEPSGGQLPGEVFALTSSAGAFEYTPPTGFTGTRVFEYTVTDGTDESAHASITFTVTAPALPTLPTIPSVPASDGSASGGGEGGSLAATGVDGAGLAGTAILAGLLVGGGLIARRFTRREA